MRHRLTIVAAALVSSAVLSLLVPACDGGGGNLNPDADNDGDGYPQKEDCDDNDPEVNPEGTEPCACDSKDNDCNGIVDDFDCDLVCYPPIDSDGDGFEPPADCNDQDPTIHPDAVEPCECDSIDQDCSGDPQDFDCDLVCHFDNDNDGYDDTTDCNDNNGSIHPGATEKCECDTVDQDCDGSVKDIPGGDCMITCTDNDGDNVFAEGGDCDDDNSAVKPGATEKCECDAIDQDCSGDPIDFDSGCALTCPDNDGDGVPLGPDCDDNDDTVKPGPGPEPCSCDGADNDCNGTIDDFDATCMLMCTYLADGDPCTAGMEPACGAGLACCDDGAGATACVTKCTGANCNGNCPMP